MAKKYSKLACSSEENQEGFMSRLSDIIQTTGVKARVVARVDTMKGSYEHIFRVEYEPGDSVDSLDPLVETDIAKIYGDIHESRVKLEFSQVKDLEGNLVTV